MSTAPEVQAKRTGYLELVGNNPNFRYLWFGQIVSLLGDWFNLIASASLVATLTASGLAVGGLFVVRMLAPFLVSPLAGVIADRYNRKWVLVLTDVIRAVTVLGFLFIRHPDQVWLLYALTAFQLGVSGVFFPARNAILPDIVSRTELGAANALSSATWSVMLAFGAALGGIVSGGWGIYPAFLIDSLTFLISGLLIARINYKGFSELAAQDASLRAAVGQYLDGLRYLKGNVEILVLSIHKAALGFAVFGALQVIQVTLTEQVFVIGEGGGISLGILYALLGVGSGIGPILARRFTGDAARPLRLALALSYVFAAAGLLLIASLASFELVMLGTLVRAFGSGIIWVFSTQLLLMAVPDSVRGRVFATEFALFTLSNAASSALGGWLLDRTTIGIPGVLLALAALTLVLGAAWTLWVAFGPKPTPTGAVRWKQEVRPAVPGPDEPLS